MMFAETCVRLAKEFGIMVTVKLEMIVPNDGMYITLEIRKDNYALNTAIHTSKMDEFGVDFILNYYVSERSAALLTLIEEKKEKEMKSNENHQ